MSFIPQCTLRSVLRNTPFHVLSIWASLSFFPFKFFFFNHKTQHQTQQNVIWIVRRDSNKISQLVFGTDRWLLHNGNFCINYKWTIYTEQTRTLISPTETACPATHKLPHTQTRTFQFLCFQETHLKTPVTCTCKHANLSFFFHILGIWQVSLKFRTYINTLQLGQRLLSNCQGMFPFCKNSQSIHHLRSTYDTE